MRDRSWVLPTAVGLFVALWSFRPIWDMDIWWHLALGRSIWTGGLPVTDILSAVLPERSWSTFQGGYELGVASLHSLGGLRAVRLAHALAIGGGFAILAHVARRISGSTWLALAVVAMGLVLYEDRIRVRPHVFHFLFVMGMFLRVARPAPRWNWKDLMWLTPLMMAWASLHTPASLWGVALIGAVAAVRWREKEGWGVLGVCLVAMALTPGVMAGALSALDVHAMPGMQERFVPEHGPLSDYVSSGMGPHGWLVVALVVTCGIGAIARVLSTSGRGGQWRPLLFVALGMGLFSLLMVRFAWHALAPALVILALWPISARMARIVAVCMIGLLVFDAHSYVQPRYERVDRWGEDVHPGKFPETAVDYMVEAGVSGRIHNQVGWGGYLLHRLHPESRTLYDSRIAFGTAGEYLIVDEARRASLKESLRDGTIGQNEGARAWWEWRRAVNHQINEEHGVDLIVQAAPVFALPPAALAVRGWLVELPWVPLHCADGVEVWAHRSSPWASSPAPCMAALQSLKSRAPTSP